MAKKKKMKKMPKGHRIIEGEAYRRDNRTPEAKKKAKTRASSLRGQGMKARVVPTKGGYDTFTTQSKKRRTAGKRGYEN